MRVTQGSREPASQLILFSDSAKPFLILGHDLKQEVPLSSSKYGM